MCARELQQIQLESVGVACWLECRRWLSVAPRGAGFRWSHCCPAWSAMGVANRETLRPGATMNLVADVKTLQSAEWEGFERRSMRPHQRTLRLVQPGGVPRCRRQEPSAEEFAVGGFAADGIGLRCAAVR